MGIFDGVKVFEFRGTGGTVAVRDSDKGQILWVENLENGAIVRIRDDQIEVVGKKRTSRE